MEDHTLTVLPMGQTMEVKAGEVYEGTITVASPDDAKAETKYTLSVGPYGVMDETYTADLTTKTNRSMLVDWIELSETGGTIEAGGKKEIKFTIKVPEKAPAGGQYAMISVAIDDEVKIDSGDALNVSNANIASMGSVIYVAVDGETVHKGEILENTIPGFANTLPVTIRSKVKNDGNVHEVAKYTVTATDVFTGRVILPEGENSGEYTEVIMPETTYLSEREVGNLPLIGVVKLTQNVQYMGEESYAEQTVLICPTWFMILVFLTLAAFAATVTMIVRRHRKKRVEKYVGV